MTRILMAPTAALALLAGCGNAGTAAPVAAAGGEMRPGLWSTTTTSRAGARTMDTCITEADVAAASFVGMTDDKTCRFARKVAANGVVDIDATCGSAAEGGEMRMTVKGSYGPDRYRIETQLAMPDMPAMPATVIEARRTGATCPAPTNQ